MFNVPNLLTILRFPLAFVFLQQNIALRLAAIVIAMATDALDGFIARRYNSVNKVGTVLDPIMDKFFVIFILGVLIEEQRLTIIEALLMLSRDAAVILYGLYLIAKGNLFSSQFRAIWCGKITTFFQFMVLICATLGIVLPNSFFIIFILLGILALGELYATNPAHRKVHH